MALAKISLCHNYEDVKKFDQKQYEDFKRTEYARLNCISHRRKSYPVKFNGAGVLRPPSCDE